MNRGLVDRYVVRQFALGCGVLIMLSPIIAMVLLLWLGLACIAAWLFVGPIDFCTAIYMD